MEKTKDLTSSSEAGSIKKRSQVKEVWRRFCRNKQAMVGMCMLLLLIFAAIFADIIAPYDPVEQDIINRLKPPSSAHWFGTDELGRDIFSILLNMSIVAAWGTGLQNVMIAIGISSVPAYCRIMRASLLSLKEQEFVDASRAAGASDVHIIIHHILPNSLAPLIVQATLKIGGAILSCASMSFIGLGIVPPTPEWGAMLSTGRDFLRDAPHLTAFPGMAIMFAVFAMNLMGDGLRDALDPKLKN